MMVDVCFIRIIEGYVTDGSSFHSFGMSTGAVGGLVEFG